MIKIIFNSKKNHISYLEVSGHAQTLNKNESNNLVCAGVSSIMYGILNALSEFEFNKENLKIEKNKIIIYNNKVDKTYDTILEVALIQLLTVQESYKKFVSIEEKHEKL